MAQQQQDEVNLPGPDHPADETEEETGCHAAGATVDTLDGQVDRLGPTHPLGPVTFPGETVGRADQLAEKTAPLQEVEPPDLHGEKTARRQGGDAQGMLREMTRLRAQKQHSQQGEQDLRDRLECRTDRDCCSSVRHGHAPVREVTCHQNGAADLPRGQEAVGRLASPTRQNRVPHRTR